jgi:hypothetical protein
MSPRGPRHRIAPGIYQDAVGLAGTVKLRGVQRERRFPADTDPRTIVTWQRRQRAKLELDLDTPDAPTTTLNDDVAAYLALLPTTGTTLRNARDDLRHWQAVAGPLPRTVLSAQMIEAQLAAWLKGGAAASTVNHRRRVLSSLWQALDGRSAPNPVKDVPKRPEPRRTPRGLPWPILRRILGRVRRGKTRVRLFVMAHTGWPQSILARLEPRDLHLTGSTPRPSPRGRAASHAP